MAVYYCSQGKDLHHTGVIYFFMFYYQLVYYMLICGFKINLLIHSIWVYDHKPAIARTCFSYHPFKKNKGQQKVNHSSHSVLCCRAVDIRPHVSPHVFCPTAVSGSSVPEWIEFVVVWLPTSNGFLNCIFYFWINRSFRRKFHLVLQRLALALCPDLAETLECCSASKTQFVSGILDNNNSVHERSSSVSSTCTLLSLA